MAKYFTLDFYEALIRRYKTLRVMDYPHHKTGLILRHDVDMSLDLAFELSRLEKKNSILSTYYILLTTDFYNPFSLTSKQLITTMINDGFEIGLHFDPLIYGNISTVELQNKLLFQKNVFESFYDYKIFSFSLHNPSIHGTFFKVDNLICAYNNELTNENDFISDSSFSYRGKDPEEFIEKSKYHLMQFLTHPVHFFNDGKLSYEKSINIIVNKFYDKIDNIHKLNKVYAQQRKKYKIEVNIDNK